MTCYGSSIISDNHNCVTLWMSDMLMNRVIKISLKKMGTRIQPSKRTSTMGTRGRPFHLRETSKEQKNAKTP